MNHRFLCIFTWMGFAAPLCAQDANIPPPLPPGPLIERAPDYSTWTITFQGHHLEGKEPLKTGTNDKSVSKDKEPVTMVSTVIKTGSTILEQNVDAEGRRHHIWHFSGLRIMVASVSNPMVCPDYGGGDIFSTSFASSDFAGFDWLSPNTYWGMAKYQGYDCIVFKGTVSPLTVMAQKEERADIEQARALGHPMAVAKVPAIAYVELKTRLPLFAQFGQEKRFYHYSSAPTSPLALPPKIADFVKAYAEQIQRLSAPASPAY